MPHSPHLRKNRCLLASNLKLEEPEFVVDSGASMHIISKKNLNSDEMDSLTTSRSPTIVLTANGEVQTHEEATVYVKELDIFLTMKVLDNTPAVLSLGKLCDKNGYFSNGSMVKNHIPLKTVSKYNATRRTSFRSWSQACQQVHPPVLILQHQWHLQNREVIILHLSQARLLHQPQLCLATVRLEKWRCEWDRFPSSTCVKFTCWTNRTGWPVLFRHTGVVARI